MLQGTGSDVRYAVRALRGSPAFTLVAVLSLAIGIGANTAAFGVVRALLLRPLPVESPDELTLLAWDRNADRSVSQIGSTSYADPSGGRRLASNFSYPAFRALRGAAPPGVDVFAFAFLRGASLVPPGRPALVGGGALVDGRYFSTLGVEMALGRPLTEADDVPDAPLVAVLGHSFWTRGFGGDPEVVGRTVRVNGIPAEVVGVTAPGFAGLSMGGFFPRTDITLPITSQGRVYPRMAPDRSLLTAEDVLWVRLMARVPSGTSRALAEEALEAAFRSHPSPVLEGDGPPPVLRLLPGARGAQPVRAETARLLWLLLGVVAVVLLIACVNLAGLMLARGVARQREMAVRRALGGGRARLVRLALMESLVLALLGTAAGVGLVLWSRGPLSGLLARSLGNLGADAADPDPVVLAVGAALGITTTVLFGLFPALRLSALTGPVATLERGPAGASAPRLTAGRVLIALQIAVTVPLVVGAALLLRTVHNLDAVELGFDPQELVTFQVDPGYAQVPEDQHPRLYRELLERLRGIRGVRSATLLENALMSGIVSNTYLTVDGIEHELYRNAVGPDFVRTMGMRVLAGRAPDERDGPDDPLVGAVNETAVAELFGGGSALGRTLQVGSREVRIVGVLNDTPYRDQRAPVPPTLYESAYQRAGYGGHHVVLRIDGPAGRLEPAIREAVSAVDPDLPVPGIRSQADLIAESSARERVVTRLLSLFGGFALLLASVGLHGVTSYAVSRRTAEIGVRVAVGARPGQILWLVLRQVLLLAGIGLVVGVPTALATGPLVGSLLYGVAPTDAAVLAGAVATLLAVAAGAALLPALRAVRLDPLTALRTE